MQIGRYIPTSKQTYSIIADFFPIELHHLQVDLRFEHLNNSKIKPKGPNPQWAVNFPCARSMLCSSPQLRQLQQERPSVDQVPHPPYQAGLGFFWENISKENRKKYFTSLFLTCLVSSEKVKARLMCDTALECPSQV